MLRKLCYSSLALVALVAVGCGPKGDPTTPETSTTTGGKEGGSAKKFKISVSLPSASHGWMAGAIWWAEKAKTDASGDAEITIVTADNPGKQASDIETMLASKPDAIVVLASESAALTPVAKKVKEQGVMLISVDRGFDEKLSTLFLQGDNKGFGSKAAEFIGTKLAGKGNILVLEGIPSTVNTDRTTAFAEALKAYPDIKVLDQQAGKWNRADALNVTQTMLLKHPKVDAIWAADDDMALGVEQALKEAGRTGVWIVGGGGMKDIVKRIMDGDATFPATVTYSPKMIGDAVLRTVDMLKKGEKAGEQKDEIVPVEIVTKDNAKDHYFPESVY